MVGIEDGGRKCGNSNINLVVLNSKYAISRVEKQREGERDTHTQNNSDYSICLPTTTTPKVTRVSLYSNGLRVTSLHTIYKDSLTLDCPRDGVNTAIIYPYSTIGVEA